MNLDLTLQKAKTWINPKYPGLNKSIPLGAVCGFFGPIGAGLYLRSGVDFGLTMILVTLLTAFTGDGPGMQFVPCVACSLWVAGRIAWDTKRSREAEDGTSLFTSQ